MLYDCLLVSTKWLCSCMRLPFLKISRKNAVAVAMRSFLVANKLHSWHTPHVMIIYLNYDVKTWLNSEDVIYLGDLKSAAGAALMRVQVLSRAGEKMSCEKHCCMQRCRVLYRVRNTTV